MLFTTTELQQREEAERMLLHPEKCAKYISPEIEEDLAQAIGELKDETSYHFDTGTRWNLHDLLVYLVKHIGPAEIYFSTYAIKEYQVRLLVGLKEEGLITTLVALLDYRNEVLDDNAMQLLSANATALSYMRTHSKLTVIIGSKLSATITGSANLTENTTADTGVITIHPEIAIARKNWILKHISK